MVLEIRRGARGHTVGPLKPSGRIRIGGEFFAASSEGNWIDAEMEVVVTGNRSNNLIVRPLRSDDPAAESLQEILLPAESADSPLHAPTALVERFNPVIAGTIIASALIPIATLSGLQFSLGALLLPVAGLIVGALFKWFVRGASEWAGPRADHRPDAIAIANTLVGAAAMGGCLGIYAGFGFLGLGCGLVLGAVLGGFVGWMVLMLTST